MTLSIRYPEPTTRALTQAELFPSSGNIYAPLAVCHSSTTAASANFRQIIQNQLDDIEKAGTYKRERIIVSPQATSINVEGSQGKILNFCANNYLGVAVSNDRCLN